MKRVKSFFLYWVPPFLWMGFIFFLSSHQKVSVTQTYAADFAIFKTLHIFEYAILYFLFFRAFYRAGSSSLSERKKLIYPILFSIAFAITDETHQLFTPTRSGQIQDIIIDTIGVLLMYWYIKYNLKVIRKFL